MNYFVKNEKQVLAIKSLLFATFFVSISFFIQYDKSLNIWDEGYLWYGAQQTFLGHVPIRDFMSYDPGRYYWISSFMQLFGSNGIISVRLSIAIFQVLGLSIAIYCILNSSDDKHRNIIYVFFLTMILLLWMIPRHKIFDIVLSIFLFYSLIFYLENKILKRVFFLGVVVGLVALFGRNHGLYGFISSTIVIFVGCFAHGKSKFLLSYMCFLCGILLGFSPILIMSINYPGFFEAFLESIVLLLHQGSTNASLNVPWPWKFDFMQGGLFNYMSNLFTGSCFLLLLLYSIIGTSGSIYLTIKGRKLSNYLIVSPILSLAYTHFAFSRADIPHLAQSIFPMLIGIMCFIFNIKSKLFKYSLFLIFITTTIIMTKYQPYGQCFIHNGCERMKIGTDYIFVPKNVVVDIKFLSHYIDKYLAEDETMLVSPYWPGAYAIWGKKSPIWENYSVFPRDEEFQNKEIKRIESSKTKLIIIYNMALDGRDEYRFSNSHKIIFDYILSHYKRINEVPSSPDFYVFIKK
jgi:hypothetical protein